MQYEVKFNPLPAGVFKAQLMSASKVESKFSNESFAFTFAFPYRRMNEKQFVTGNKLAPLDHSVNETPREGAPNELVYYVNVGKSNERFYKLMLTLGWPDVSEDGFTMDVNAKGEIDLSPLGAERWYQVTVEIGDDNKQRITNIAEYVAPRNGKAKAK